MAIAGYLVWLRSRYQPAISPQPGVEETLAPVPVVTSKEEATSSAVDATSSSKEKTATSSSVAR